MKEEAKQPEILTIPAPLMQDIMNVLQERPLREVFNIVRNIEVQVKPLREPEKELISKEIDDKVKEMSK